MPTRERQKRPRSVASIPRVTPLSLLALQILSMVSSLSVRHKHMLIATTVGRVSGMILVSKNNKPSLVLHHSAALEIALHSLPSSLLTSSLLEATMYSAHCQSSHHTFPFTLHTSVRICKRTCSMTAIFTLQCTTITRECLTTLIQALSLLLTTWILPQPPTTIIFSTILLPLSFQCRTATHQLKPHLPMESGG